MHCGPPIDAMISGIVMNGPTPTMLLMLSAVACSSPETADEAPVRCHLLVMLFQDRQYTQCRASKLFRCAARHARSIASTVY